MQKAFHKEMTKKAPVYIYATEMVSSYYNLLALNKKRVLSIVGSGDQIINAYYFGAKEVVGFDINQNSLFILEIKFVFIRHLNRKDYLEFFGTNMNNATLSFKLYEKIRKNLSVKTKLFFDTIYKEFNYNGKAVFKSKYFRQRNMFKYLAQDINIYLKTDRNYLKCRNILRDKKIIFHQLDLNDIASNKKLKGKFDIINLSNVLNYLTGNTKEEDLLKELLVITKNISQRINKEGLFFYYSYTPSIYSKMQKKVPPASRIKLIESFADINKFILSIKRFKGVSKNSLDRINIFKK